MVQEIHFPIRMGVIGTGRIAERFIPEVKHVKELKVVGVYNPRYTSADAFALRHNLEITAKSAEELFNQVDAVYIASPHETHYGYIIRALQHGIHVWCEKPMVLKKSEAEQAFALAKSKNCVLMEGIKTAFCPGFLKVMNILRSGEIGQVRDVEAGFTKLADPATREMMAGDFSGSFTELGSYPLFAIMRIMGTEYQDMRFETFFDDNGVDIYTKAYFKYKGGIATAKTGLGVKSEGQLLISGTQGYIKVNAPWWKTTEFEVCFEDTSQNQVYKEEFSEDGLRYGLNTFADAISSIKEARRTSSEHHEVIEMANILEIFLNEKLTRRDIKHNEI